MSTTRGLYKFDPNSSRITRYLHDFQESYSLSANLINQAHEDRMGRFWVASAGGLDEFDIREGKVKRRAPLRMPVGWSHQDRFGVFWMTGGDLSCALASWDLSTDRVRCHSIQFQTSHKLEKINVGRIIEDIDGTLWLTSSHGLLKLGPERSELIRYHNNPLDSESPESDKMISIFQDREGNIWTCFQTTEPNYFSRGPRNFENFTYRRGELIDPLVTSIYEDHRGILWIGSMGGLNRIDRRTGRNIVPPGSGVRNEILSILEDRSQVLIAGTYHRGLEKIDPDSGRMSAYVQGKNSNSAKNPIMRLMFDHAGNLWAAAASGGIGRFNAVSGNFITFTPDLQDLIEYQAIAEDVDGTMWVGGQTGLHHFDPRTQEFTLFKHGRDAPNSLSDNRVNTIHIDPNGQMWVGTQNGLDKFDRKSGTFQVYTDRDGLGGNVVGCILEDRRGALWMSTNNGLSKLDPTRNRFENYSTFDDLPGPDLTGWGACYQSPSGEMFFGGFSGATAFYPERIAHNGFVPTVALTDFRLSGVSIPPGRKSLLEKSITFSNSVEITHTQNDFSIEFSALSFLDPETNRYRYRLIGLDGNWHEAASDQRLASFTTLPVRSYTFEVEGATSHGRWSIPTKLGIRILPAWYQTAWFRASCVVAFLGLLWALYRFRLHQIAERFNTRMEARVDERTRIARELHDTLLQSFQALMIHFQAVDNLLPPGKGKDALEKVLDRADRALVEGRNAIQNIRSSTTVTNELSHAVTALGEELAGSHDGETGPATFRVSVEGTPRDLRPILRDDIYRIAREALQNAFRHAQASQIEADITYGDSLLRLRVRDDGKGIDPKHLHAGRDGHWGLPGMRERAQQIGAQFEMWSEVGAGTEVELRIPGSIVYAKARGRGGLRLFRKKKEGSNER